MSTAVLSFPPHAIPAVGTYPYPPSTPKSVEPKKSNHQANIVRISEILPHPDPETTNLELIHIGGYQVVVRKGAFAVGDLGVYIQPDSVVPQTEPFRFLWEQYIGIDGTVPEKRRRITVRKFRKEWSEGLLLPISDFGLNSIVSGGSFVSFHEGDDVSDLLGITHYDPDAGVESTKGTQVAAPRRKYPTTLRGFFWFVLAKLGFRKAHKNYAQEVSFHLPEYDVEAFKNHANTFEDGEQVIITEKIHGSNARFVCIDNVMYTGSRTQWKSPDSKTVWTRAVEEIGWIGDWCRAHPGYALYGEVTPTQKGKGVTWDYGSKDVQFFLFDILSPDGTWVNAENYSDLDLYDDSGLMSNGGAPLEMVPVLYTGPFSKEIALQYVDGPSTVLNATHIREGIVIKAVNENGRTGRGRKQLKIVSNAFLDKDNK